jgi:hypothetical protein
VASIFSRLGHGVQKEEVLAQGQEGSVGRVSGKAQPVARRRNLTVLPHNSSLDTLSVVESNRGDDEPRGLSLWGGVRIDGGSVSPGMADYGRLQSTLSKRSLALFAWRKAATHQPLPGV